MNFIKLFSKLSSSFQKKGMFKTINSIKPYYVQYCYLKKINNQYQYWLKKNTLKKPDFLKQKKESSLFKYQPKISIITPVYNPPTEYLKLCIDSVLKQTYQNWEFCLADDNSTDPEIKKIINAYAKKDSRIKIIFRPKNGHISEASNSALKIATGEYISLLDNDDEIAPQALFKIIQLLNQSPEADLIYSDEDKLEINGQFTDPSFKPNWSPDLFLSTNYLCHLTTIRKSLVDAVNGFTKGLEGAQDYDLILKIIEKTKNIFHISDILYHWRKIPGSTAAIYSTKSYAYQASVKSLEDHLKRTKTKGFITNGLQEGTFRVVYQTNKPLISIIIPTKDKIKYLKKCVESIIKKSTYKKYEIIIVDTNSTDQKTFNYYQKLKNNPKIKILSWNQKFNFSDVNNYATKNCQGEYLIFLNNDTEVITPDWIESMLQLAQNKNIGAVGCKLLYQNKNIQHAGVILGLGGIANHNFYRMPDEISQPFPMLNSKDVIRNFSAVTGACLMINKNKFLSVSGFDSKLKIAYNDIDLCLKLNQKGYRTVYTPFAKLYHHESISISKNRDENQFQKEQTIMTKRWENIITNDPFYNLNLKKIIT
ncbi:MAG: glycosyltransferase family 2 protein [Candidatus Shapirobacteria bacterium]|nr:glycosyltransferase family 2 protein [Candidatus Shapirobacteria bacterium]MDD3002712.1 glycosyltransferase family 2 protein [Candidatus Shapirobacteria bacterium]MDD4383209.1 glycosyltransferase family 2 protein [Candidatus Shapirobacteria bacterium]